MDVSVDNRHYRSIIFDIILQQKHILTTITKVIKPLTSLYFMKLVLAEPKFLKEPILIISELVNEVRVKFKTDSVEIVAMDPANVAMVIFKLLSSSFVEYSLAEEKEIGLNLDNLKQILRRAKPSDTLILELDENNNRLKISLRGDSSRTFKLSLIEIADSEQKVPELNFLTKIEIPTTLFDEAIEDMEVVSDAVTFTAEPAKFTIESAGHLSDAKVELVADEETKIVTHSSITKSKYSIEYLKKIIKGSKLSDTALISFDKDYPLKIEYKLMDKLTLSFILAPRVAND